MATLITCGALAACRSAKQDTIIEEPAEPPLPPASGTPIGLLLDDAGSLSLRANQIDELRAIDQSLQARNDEIDAQERGLDRAAEQRTADADEHGRSGAGRRGRGGRGGRGGMGGGGMGGPPPGAGGAGGRPHHQHGGGPPASRGGAGARGTLDDEKLANVRDAIARALIVLDTDQRTHAERILEEHGAAEAPKPLPPSPDRDETR